jgi:hypothetical protein
MKQKRLRGRVEKIIKPVGSGQPEKAQITIEGADDLYREIRIENTLPSSSGEKEGLHQGQSVDIVIEAESSVTIKKP